MTLHFLKDFRGNRIACMLVAAIVNHLQPNLLPYEATIYCYLFRQSVVGPGQQYTRSSVKANLKCESASSSRGNQATSLSENAVTEALRGLEKKGAIIKAVAIRIGNWAHFLKRFLPEEIPICQERMQASARIPILPVNEKTERRLLQCC